MMNCHRKKTTLLLVFCFIFLCFVSGCTSRYDLKEGYHLTKKEGSLENLGIKLSIIPQNVSKTKKLRFPFYWEERSVKKGPYKIRLILTKKGSIPKILIEKISISTNFGKKLELLNDRKLAVKFEPPPDSISARKDFIFSRIFDKELDLSFKDKEKLNVSIGFCFENDGCERQETLFFEFEPSLIESEQKIPFFRV